MPLIKPSHNTKYVVRIIRACGPPIVSEGVGDFYRVRVWPENLEIMSEETNWVSADTGAPEFDQSFTFHHHSPLSTFTVSLELERSPAGFPEVSQLAEPSSSNLVRTVIGTGSSVQVPTELQIEIENKVPIFDEDQHYNGSIIVHVVKVE